jgi:hypothetical protein
MKLYHLLTKVLKKPVFKFTRSVYDRQALKKIKKNTKLYQTITDYISLSESTGCSYFDYWTLYNTIRKNKPAEILECGTGVSSVVMAYALMENEQAGSLTGRITSMEDVDLWYQKAAKLIPDNLKPYVEIVHSPKVEYCHSIFRGVGYQDIPQRAYEFVFVDGPETTAPSDGTLTFDFDLINVVTKADHPVSAIVDKRAATCYVFQKLFGIDKVKFDARCDVCFVGPLTKADLKSRMGGGAFMHTFRIFGNSELNFIMKS